MADDQTIYSHYTTRNTLHTNRWYGVQYVPTRTVSHMASLRQREKSYYYDARETHYNRFGPHAWFDPGMRGRTHR